MKKEVFTRNGSVSLFNRTLLQDLNTNEWRKSCHIEANKENHNNEKDNQRDDTAPHFHNPDEDEVSAKNIHVKNQESLFNCPEVSPVKTNKQSFANRDENASMMDLYP